MSNLIEKPWGSEEILEINNSYVLKKLIMKKGHQCSLQYHEYKHETIYVVSGQLNIYYLDKWKVYYPGDVLVINPKDIHRMKAVDTDCVYLEASTTELDDVIRLEDDYRKID
tara:strand:+ start:45316 stop:45651 length:336 start_codon:yes stop_codon:yes gene_type:complete